MRTEDELARLRARRRAEARGEPGGAEAVSEPARGLAGEDAENGDRPAAWASSVTAAMAEHAGDPGAPARQELAEEQEHLLADVRANLERFRQRSAGLAKDYLRALGHPLASPLKAARP